MSGGGGREKLNVLLAYHLAAFQLGELNITVTDR